MLNFQLVHNPRISHDGKDILFTVAKATSDTDYQERICKYTDGQITLLVACRAERHSNPTWSNNDQRILYLTTKKEQGNHFRTYLSVLNRSGNRKETIVSLRDRKITQPKWSVDDGAIYFLSDYEDDTETRSRKTDTKIITRRRYKYDGAGFLHDKRTHIFKVKLDDEKGLRPTRLSKGEFDVVSYDVHPNREDLIFTANMSEMADFQYKVDIFQVSNEGGPVTQLFKNQGPIDTIAISPNGRYLSFVGHNNRFNNWFNTPFELWTLDLDTGEFANISHQLDRSLTKSIRSDSVLHSYLQPPIWGSNSKEIYFLATDRMSSQIFRSGIEAQKIDQITNEKGVIEEFTVSKNNRIAFVMMTSQSLCELYMTEVQSKPKNQVRHLTNLNDKMLSGFDLCSPYVFTFVARDGKKIEGFLMPPIGKNSAEKSPCIVEVHGGGGTEGFQFMHEFQCLCAAGFAVLTCNFRGTPGYGEEMMKALNGHFMEENYTDIIDMVDYAIQQGWIDEKRIGITGNSLGGWLTVWAIEHSERFAAAVACGSVVNLHSYYGTTDDQRSLETDIFLGHLPWEAPDRYLNISPIKYIDKIKTPLLLIHSEQDHRVSIEQAEQLFSALKRLGKDVVLVQFPEESHSIAMTGKPFHKVERLGFLLWWFTSYINSGYHVNRPV